MDIRLLDTICIASYEDREHGEPTVLKKVRDLGPAAHFATVYAKPAGRPLVDTFITEVSQDTGILFPWDTELQSVPPIVHSTSRI